MHPRSDSVRDGIEVVVAASNLSAEMSSGTPKEDCLDRFSVVRRVVDALEDSS